MKKLTFSIFAATLAFGANADVEPASASNSCAYDGLFFGLGISAVDAGVKTETTYAYGATGFGTADPHAPVYERMTNAEGIDSNDHDTRFTGNAVLGYGKRIQEKAYIALEAGLDAGQNSNFCHPGIATTEEKKYEVYSKNNGLIPSAALRLGYIHPETKTMVYLKAGAAYSQARTSYVDTYLANHDVNKLNSGYAPLSYEGKCSKWTPIVAFGFEKVTGKNFRTRAEVEYRFQTTKSFDFDNSAEKAVPGSDIEAEYKGTIKIYNKAAVTLRIMGLYTVK